MKLRNLLLILSLGAVILSGNGCASLSGGGTVAGTVTYAFGELRSLEEASLDRVWEATQKTMEDLELITTSREKDTLTGRLVARGTYDRRIVTTLKKISEELSEVRIRVGTFGDETLSRNILKQLKKNLGLGIDAAAAGIAVYSFGTLRSIEEASLDRTWQAAERAVMDLQYTVTSIDKNALGTKLIARGAGDRKLEINLKKLASESTEIRIRVGIFGEEALSRLVLKRIKKNLFF